MENKGQSFWDEVDNSDEPLPRPSIYLPCWEKEKESNLFSCLKNVMQKDIIT